MNIFICLLNKSWIYLFVYYLYEIYLDVSTVFIAGSAITFIKEMHFFIVLFSNWIIYYFV